MTFSAVSRSWIGRRVLSRRFSVGEAADAYFVSCCRPHSSVERMMSTSTGSSDVPPSSPPLLMLPAAVDRSGSIAYTFHCLARNENITCNTDIDIGSDDIINDVKFAGSSRGWLALYNRRNHDLLLSDPIAQRHLKLPSLPGADRVILSTSSSSLSCREEDTCLAFASDVNGRLAYCSLRHRSSGWTAFGTNGRPYENLVYSTRHRRLFCVTFESCTIESWVVRELERESGSPTLSLTLDREIRCDIRTNDPLDEEFYRWPRTTRWELKKRCHQLTYLVSDETSGDLFLVVRHVNPRSCRHGSLVDRIVFSAYDGCHYHRNPYRTVDFDVFRVDCEGGKVEHLTGSLGGLAMFVGINEPLAIPSTGVGVGTDCIYFTDENRLLEPTRLLRTNYGGHDNGVFDYRSLGVSPCCDYYPIEFDKIRKTLPLPQWFTLTDCLTSLPTAKHN